MPKLTQRSQATVPRSLPGLHLFPKLPGKPVTIQRLGPVLGRGQKASLERVEPHGLDHSSKPQQPHLLNEVGGTGP